ncbi:MAG: phosphate propanoyltransferase [Planctomycetes bacterium]|nr:phosphate propanoyltransferase [Planctomycetota bacterium]
MSAIAKGSGVDRAAIEQMVRQVVRQRLGLPVSGPRADGHAPKLLVNISARHMHVTEQDLETLFGPGAKLTVLKPLYQEGHFASEQTVTIIGPRHRTITNLRILGPCRKDNQIELAFTDAIAMGIDVPVRMSGNVQGTPGCIVLGPKGYIEMKQGVIRAQRHVHMHPTEAALYGVKNGDALKLRVDGSCPMVFEGVIARVDPAVKLEVHLDTDEGNACDLMNAKSVELFK